MLLYPNTLFIIYPAKLLNQLHSLKRNCHDLSNKIKNISFIATKILLDILVNFKKFRLACGIITV